MSVIEWDGTTVTDEEWGNLELKTPVSQFRLHGGELIEIHRCEADGAIVTNQQDSLKRHPGHRLKQPILIKREEVMALVRGDI